MSKHWEPIRLRGVGGMPQYEAGSDGKCFNIRQGVRGVLQYSLGSDRKCFNIPQGVRGMHQYFLGNDVGLGKNYYS